MNNLDDRGERGRLIYAQSDLISSSTCQRIHSVSVPDVLCLKTSARPCRVNERIITNCRT